MKRIVWLLLPVFLLSCEKDTGLPETLGENSGIVGTWIQEGMEEDVTVMERASGFDPERYGFSIQENGRFTEHKNAGWCGTPPITYDQFEGTWKALSDSLMEITVGYWGGTMTYQIRIVSLDNSALKIRYLYAQDRAFSR